VTFFSKVEQVFEIPGRGCVLVPAKPRDDLDFQITLKTTVQLKKPDGKTIITAIVGIEVLSGPRFGNRLAIVLPESFKKDDIPAGTAIWLIRAC
jgi:hypothetical protein